MVVIFLPGVCIHFVDVSHKEQPPRYLFGASCQFTDEQALMAHNLSQSPSGFLATLPVPSGQWVYAPGTSWISHVRVSRSRCWNLIEQALARRHLGVHFQVALHGMLHCATTHFKTAVLSDSNQRLITIVQSMSIRFAPDILVEFVQGETYARWRNSVRSVSPFWRFAPLYDEDGYGALADEFRDLNLARFSLGDDSAGGGSATVLLPFSHGSSVSPSAASVKEECFMTPEKWWTKNLIPLSSGSFLKRLLSDQLVPVQRISLQKSKRGDDQTYAKFVQMLFQRRQIPTEQAEQLAPIYVDHLAAVVDDLVTCASRDPRSIHPHAQLSFLHVLNDALLSMQFPFRGPLPERLSRLTYSHFPMPALSECCNSSVFAAQLDAVVQSFDRLFPVSELSRPIAVEHKAISGDLSRSRLSTLPSAAAVASPAVPQSYVFKEREEDRRVGATRSVTRRNAPCTSILPFRDYLQFSFCSLVDKSRNHPEGKFTHADVEKVLAEYCGVAMVQFHRHMLGVDAMPHYMPLEQFVSQVRFRQGVGETSALAGSAKSSGAGAAEHLVLVTMKNSKVKEAQTMLRNKAITRELELVKTTRSRLAFERLLYPFAVSTLNERTLKD
jgi:hypothetical protein